MAYFVTIEGGDGAGKSTLIAGLMDYFKSSSVITTREPGGTALGEEIRTLLLAKRQEPLWPVTELLLYEAARAEHVARVIRPALRAGKHVICDRYTTSTLAYQGWARGLGLDLVRTLNAAATEGLEPDLIIWMRLSPTAASLRRAKRPNAEDRMESESSVFHERVFEGFERLASADPERFVILDASAAPQEVLAELLHAPAWNRLFGREKSHT